MSFSNPTAAPLEVSNSSPQSALSVPPVPRPEYPRPQFVRKEWLNLNGIWTFRIDDADVGLEQNWFSGSDFPGQILVPFSIESPMSGIGDRSFHPCVWYQRS